MPPEGLNYPEAWLRIAAKDWQRVDRLLEDEDEYLAGFCLQQAVEKYLKAFLLSKGWQLRKIHDLETLLDDALVFAPEFEKYRATCQTISAFYLAERYPPMIDFGLKKEDIVENREVIGKLVASIQSDIAARQGDGY